MPFIEWFKVTYVTMISRFQLQIGTCEPALLVLESRSHISPMELLQNYPVQIKSRHISQRLKTRGF
ncbi:hypothetical protein E2C01_071347 [Portunus trituberculatus]|uniref:Uncharacterized protein n=1 Tax=Portunus trituberculatus TaxID=210409 RepID=A0A5B7HZQ9_PORTR|nr:hypothetical protein [Portunus trituberculatus]